MRAAVKIVAKQSRKACHDVDSIARCLRRNTAPSRGIARSLYSNTTSRSVAWLLCRNTLPSLAIARTAYRVLYSNTTASRSPSAETPHRHPALRGHSIVPMSDVRGQTSRGQKFYRVAQKSKLYICDHNSGKTHSIFIIFELL